MSQLNSAAYTDPTQRAERLHYLDTLRVIAVFMVFVFHASHPFTLGGAEIRNPQENIAVTAIFAAGLAPWGMPFFFLLAGAGVWFALQRRTGRQFTRERFWRLFVPFLIGCAIFTPIQEFFEWKHELRVGSFVGSLIEHFIQRFDGWNPTIFGWLGYHLWFLGYLFVDSLLLLPLFQWLKGEAGRRAVSRLAGLIERRGGILLYILPLLVIQLGLRPFFPGERNWADFFYYPSFFLAGYVIYSDARFLTAIRRDRWLLVGMGIVALLGLLVSVALGNAETLFSDASNPGFYPFWACAVIDAWCWSLVMLYVGMRFLDFTNRWTLYGRQAIVPFYLVHQPVIFLFAYFVVQWDAGVIVKFPVIVVGAFVVSAVLYELVIRRVAPLRVLFGMKASPESREVSSP